MLGNRSSNLCALTALALIPALLWRPARCDTPERNPEPVQGVRWGPLLRQSAAFLGIMQGFRLATEEGTRQNLRRPLWPGYLNSLGNLHGWGDGDPFYVNYIGHSMQGAVSGRLFNQNDTEFRRAEFGRNAPYWKSRLRAAAFAWAFSAQFEIGPFSEATIGRIQSEYRQQGFVDHVITPSLGLGWTVAEDAVDKYFIRRVEGWTRNPWVRLAVRGSLNPTRSLANALRGKPLWHRDTRSGVFDYEPFPRFKREKVRRLAWQENETADRPRGFGIAPLEVGFAAQPVRFATPGGGQFCVAGGGSVAYRVAPRWQLVLDVGGCKMYVEKNMTGDYLGYLVGPRWTPSPAGRWSPYGQVLFGGSKFTHETVLLDVQSGLAPPPPKNPSTMPLLPDYLRHLETSGVAFSAGGGLDLRVHRALALRVASLEYRRAWGLRDLDGRDYSSGLSMTMGVVLRMGTW